MKTCFAFALVLLVGAALAPRGLAQHGHGQAAAAAGGAVAEAYRAVNATMHRDMEVPLTGDADRDFVLSMIPHHQGAVDMAKIVLAHGKDPEIRRLAESIVASQEAEIRQMKEWLAQAGAAAPR
jgi:uncharacterized protein (DUF305 family)